VTDQTKRITIDAPSEIVILAARHLDATEGPVQVGRLVDTATRSAITTVLRYIAKAHNTPPAAPADGRLCAADFTAAHWHQAAIDRNDIPAAHAIACIRAALKGETQPGQLGLDESAHDAFRAALDEPAPAPASTCSEHDGPCFPDPTARCPAHGDHQCAECHRNPSTCNDRDYVECGYWTTTGMHWDTCTNRIRGPITTPGPVGEPHTGLVVQPYRNDRGEHAWVFRCWGTDTCDGWLSLDHASEQSALRARDRHVAEEHTS